MNSINLMLFVITVHGIWAQTQTKKKIGKNSWVTCTKDDHCTAFMGMGATCKDDICVCENKELCKPHKTNPRVKSNVIGEDCADDFNCNIQFAVCSDGYCACIPERVASNDARKCLEVSEGLGYECEQDIQCIRKISGSVCRESKCVCDEFHHQGSSECFEKVGLGQVCKLQSQCNHIFHASCGKVYCECDEGFVASTSRTKCLPVVTEPLGKCNETVQCHQLYPYGGGACVYGRCECNHEHRLANTSDCPTRLKQFCDNDDECKSYNDDVTMHCEMSRCECKLPYVEQNGICNGSGVLKYTVFSVIFAAIFNLMLHFK